MVEAVYMRTLGRPYLTLWQIHRPDKTDGGVILREKHLEEESIYK
jgi:hypothetical protein